MSETGDPIELKIVVEVPDGNNEFVFPTAAQLMELIPNFPFPPSLPWITLPELPDFGSIAEKLALPSPIFGSISSPNMELSQILINFRQTVFMSVVKAVWDLVGGLLESVLGLIPTLPTIPDIEATIDDLIAGGKELIDKVRDALARKSQAFMDYLRSFMPLPTTFSVDSPDIDIAQIVTLMVAGYMTKVMESLTALMSKIKEAAEKILDVALSIAIPEIPEFPSLSEMIDYIKGKISIPVFSFSFPDPLVPAMQAPDIDIPQKLSIMFQDMKIYVMNKIGEFISMVYDLIPGAPELPKVRAELDLLASNLSIEVS